MGGVCCRDPLDDRMPLLYVRTSEKIYYVRIRQEDPARAPAALLSRLLTLHNRFILLDRRVRTWSYLEIVINRWLGRFEGGGSWVPSQLCRKPPRWSLHRPDHYEYADFLAQLTEEERIEERFPGPDTLPSPFTRDVQFRVFRGQDFLTLRLGLTDPIELASRSR